MSCGTFQLVESSVAIAGDTVPSVVSDDTRSIATLVLAWLCSSIVKVAVPPASVVAGPAIGDA